MKVVLLALTMVLLLACPLQAQTQPDVYGSMGVDDGSGFAGMVQDPPDYGPDGCGECGGTGCASCCLDPRCEPVWTFYGEFLALRARDAEVVYGVPFNGPVGSPPAVPIQVGRLGIVDPQYEPAFRIGFGRLLADRCASLSADYTHFESSVPNAISTESPNVIRSMVAHPSTLQASSDGLDANAVLDIAFDRVNIDYRRIIRAGERYSLNYLVGAGYANLDQRFRSQFAVNGLETVRTDIEFDGGGIRLGLEGERHACESGLMIYGRSAASFMAGEFKATYAQGQAFDASVVDTGWEAGRIVSILDLELGVGWTNCSGCFRVTAGYLISAWFNSVKTDELIQSVQSNSFVGLGDTLTFDGITCRAELRY